MFLRKYWIPILVFIVAITGVGLYMLATQPPKDPIVIYTPVEPLPKPTAKVPVSQTEKPPVGDTSQGGHFHADGTWHAEPNISSKHHPLVEKQLSDENRSDGTPEQQHVHSQSSMQVGPTTGTTRLTEADRVEAILSTLPSSARKQIESRIKQIAENEAIFDKFDKNTGDFKYLVEVED